MADNRKFYIYRHGWDIDSLGNEDVKLFSSKQRALNHMEKAVRDLFKCSIEELNKAYENSSDAVIEQDYVEIPFNKDTIYYIVEEVSLDAA